MSWTDPCSNCGQHRADCDCGDWNGYKKKRWFEAVKKEQEHYPIFRGRDLNEEALLHFYSEGKTPTEALNDLITLT